MLSRKLAIQNIPQKIKNQKILIRVDFNVPMKEGKITDTTRIQESLRTIQFCKDNGAKAITLMSHMGRPNGQRSDKLSLRSVVPTLSSMLNQEVHFLNDCVGQEVQDSIARADGGKISLLENLRFHAAEEGSTKDAEKKKIKEKPEVIQAFRQELTQLGDIYVNDAFGTSHRAHSSIVGCNHQIKAAGFLLKKELDYFAKVLENPEKPLLVIMGGAKVKDKTSILLNMLDRVDRMIITGAMAFTFLKTIHPSYQIGNSLFDSEGAEMVNAIVEKARQKNVELFLPNDFICVKEINEKAETFNSAGLVPEGLIGIDVGPDSRSRINEIIQSSRTIFLNGANGVFEIAPGRSGSIDLVNSLCLATKNGATTVCGGGDTINLIKMVQGAGDVISHQSTGGGASLELIEGKILPGLEALSDNI